MFLGHFWSKIRLKLGVVNFWATFLEFESSDRSDIAYYASIKCVEAFAKDRRSKFFFKEIKIYIIGNFFWPKSSFFDL